ncbi:hypothetical protein [Poseidonocella sp. HB161398]|uniref:hypothetical protein n=1 Tax=Poseidonocella sp. HB161398 TaxID=2320855 RepID=UPI001108423A|nr:hypothetical protein [Poseidonocella sp. HB161398]
MGLMLKLGLGGVLGLLLGLVLVAWVRPATDGGMAILVLIPVAVCSALGPAVAALFQRKGE